MVTPLVFLESISLKARSTLTQQSTSLVILSLSKACETGMWWMNILLYIALFSILHLKVTLVLTSLNSFLNSLSPVGAVNFNLLLDQSVNFKSCVQTSLKEARWVLFDGQLHNILWDITIFPSMNMIQLSQSSLAEEEIFITSLMGYN